MSEKQSKAESKAEILQHCSTIDEASLLQRFPCDDWELESGLLCVVKCAIMAESAPSPQVFSLLTQELKSEMSFSIGLVAAILRHCAPSHKAS